MSYKLSTEYRRLEESLGVEVAHTISPQINDPKDRTIVLNPETLVFRVIDRVTGQTMLTHKLEGMGPDAELQGHQEALDLAKGSEKPLTPAQMSQRNSALEAENKELKARLEGRPGGMPAETVRDRSARLTVELEAAGIDPPSGMKVSNRWCEEAEQLLIDAAPVPGTEPDTEVDPDEELVSNVTEIPRGNPEISRGRAAVVQGAEEIGV